jgi:hypothetical protein
MDIKGHKSLSTFKSLVGETYEMVNHNGLTFLSKKVSYQTFLMTLQDFVIAQKLY